MLLIPAIDIKDGRCVRLVQGEMDKVTVYSENPIAVAEKWIEAGARRLHIVDLDGAVKGQPKNADIIHTIVEQHPNIPIQVGGGIRDEDTIQSYLYAGASYVIIGTRAITTPHFVSDACIEFPGHIIVGLDTRNQKLATDGWSKLSKHNVVEIAKRFEKDGIVAIVFTDISRDGMMNSINIDETLMLCKNIKTPVIASGGLSNLDNVKALCEVAAEGICGVITGRAIYEGSLDITEAQNFMDEFFNRKP